MAQNTTQIEAEAQAVRPKVILWIGVLALLIPPLAVLLSAGLEVIPWQRVPHLLLGLAIGLLGGMAAAGVARATLRDPHTNLQLILGFVLTGLIGTLTIGYLYVFHIDSAMANITTPTRIVEQSTAFVEFLCGLGVGALGRMPG